MDRGMYAAELFLNGYNCAQAVFAAFADLMGMEKDYAARLSSSFGGGMGRMREVCGAVSGMLMVLGALYGYDAPGDDEIKLGHYSVVQALAGKFRETAGTIVCREILNNPPDDPKPTPRTEDFYKHRPCAHMVYLAASIMDQYIQEHPL